MLLFHLSEDILLDIYQRLSVLDVLALKQVCRVLHTIGCSDYLWRCGIVPNLGIPVGISNDVVKSLPAAELQRMVIKAIKLDLNWRKPTSRIKRVTPVLRNADNVSIDEMRLLLGAEWLVTAQRNRPKGKLSTSISFWSLADLDAIRRAALIEVPGTYRDFAVCFCGDKQWATLAIGFGMGNQEMLQVYKVPLGTNIDYLLHVVPTLLKSIPRPSNVCGVIHEVSVNGDIVATTFATVEDAGHSHQLFLLNLNTGKQLLVDPMLTKPFNNLSIRLSGGHIVLMGMIGNAFAMRIYRLPCSVLSNFPDHLTIIETTDDALKLHTAECHFDNLLTQFVLDFAISDSVNISEHQICSQLALVAFHLSDAQAGQGHLAHFPTGYSEEVRTLIPQTFTVPQSTSIEVVKLGTNGHRAIWLEHNWDTQQFRLMKLSTALEDQPRVGVVLPPDPQLPFSPRECQSLAFDEVTGRICVGLYTADLFILDFV